MPGRCERRRPYEGPLRWPLGCGRRLRRRGSPAANDPRLALPALARQRREWLAAATARVVREQVTSTAQGGDGRRGRALPWRSQTWTRLCKRQ